MLKSGKRLRMFFNEGNINNGVIEVRGVVDEWVIVRQRSRSKRAWQYRLEHLTMFELWHQRGVLTDARRPRKGGS